MKEKVNQIKEVAKENISKIKDLQELQELKVKLLGKKSELTSLLKGLGGLSAEERPVIGQVANKVRESIEGSISSKKEELKAIEKQKKLAEEVKRRGGLCEKWNSGTSGWPDRIVLLPDGKFGFVEVKAPGEEPRPLQLHRHKQLRQLGYKVYVLDDKDRIGEILDDIQTT